jgi:glutathione synthase/RimK-type ligase-like ATP-grasp enzyme
MKKFAFLTCDDLTEFVVDDDFAFNEFERQMEDSTYELLSWSDKSVVWSDFDFAVIRTTWDYTKNIDYFLATLKKIEESGCKLLNPYSVVKWNSHKTYLKDLEEKGIDIIPSIFLERETIGSFQEKLRFLNSKKYVLKPTVGASADKIQVLDEEEVLKQFEQCTQLQDWFVQPFIEEVLEGEISYFFFGGEYSHAVKKTPKKGDFRVQEEHGGLITIHNANEEEKTNAKKVVSCLDQELLYARVDMLITENGAKLIELELIEPSLYFRIDPKSAARYIKKLKSWSSL